MFFGDEGKEAGEVGFLQLARALEDLQQVFQLRLLVFLPQNVCALHSVEMRRSELLEDGAHLPLGVEQVALHHLVPELQDLAHQERIEGALEQETVREAGIQEILLRVFPLYSKVVEQQEAIEQHLYVVLLLVVVRAKGSLPGLLLHQHAVVVLQQVHAPLQPQLLADERRLEYQLLGLDMVHAGKDLAHEALDVLQLLPRLVVEVLEVAAGNQLQRRMVEKMLDGVVVVDRFPAPIVDGFVQELPGEVSQLYRGRVRRRHQLAQEVVVGLVAVFLPASGDGGYIDQIIWFIDNLLGLEHAVGCRLHVQEEELRPRLQQFADIAEVFVHGLRMIIHPDEHSLLSFYISLYHLFVPRIDDEPQIPPCARERRLKFHRCIPMRELRCQFVRHRLAVDVRRRLCQRLHVVEEDAVLRRLVVAHRFEAVHAEAVQAVKLGFRKVVVLADIRHAGEGSGEADARVQGLFLQHPDKQGIEPVVFFGQRGEAVVQ